jgi:SNF2 family DNA or RNA helicase
MNEKRLWLNDDHLIIDFPYDPDEVAAIKKIPGAKWDKLARVWRAPATSLSQVRDFAILHDFEVDTSIMLFNEPERLNKSFGMWSDDSWIYLGFNYDQVKVRSVKQLPGVTWDSKSKAWKVPRTAVREAIQWATVFKMDVSAELHLDAEEFAEVSKKRADASRAHSAEIEIPNISGSLLPYQMAGVSYAHQTRRCFIADDMGLGKTLQALATLEYCASLGEDVYPAIVMCPSNLVLNWKAEVEKWTPSRTATVVTDRSDFPEEEHDIIVIGYANIHHWVKSLKGYKSLICDESHYLKTPTAQRTKAAIKISKTIKSGVVLCLTGTPVTNRPAEYASQLEIIGRLNELGGTWGFYRRYCGAFKDKWGHWNTAGATNLQELNEILRSLCYIRRTKEQVLPELPDVIHDRHMVSLSEKHKLEYKKAEDDIVEYLVQRAKEIALEIGKSPHSAAVVARIKAESNVHLVKLSVLRRLAAKGKMESIKEWVKNQIEAGEKVVIAAHHRDVVDALANEFGGLKIQGGMDVHEVEKAKKDFQNLSTEEAPVIVLSMQAAKTGHTLTAAQKVLFVELPWTPADVDQLYSRCHRLGQKGSVMVTYAIATGTVDEQIYDLIQSKRSIVNAAVDGSDISSDDSSSRLVLDYLKQGLSR